MQLAFHLVHLAKVIIFVQGDHGSSHDATMVISSAAKTLRTARAHIHASHAGSSSMMRQVRPQEAEPVDSADDMISEYSDQVSIKKLNQLERTRQARQDQTLKAEAEQDAKSDERESQDILKYDRMVEKRSFQEDGGPTLKSQRSLQEDGAADDSDMNEQRLDEDGAADDPALETKQSPVKDGVADDTADGAMDTKREDDSLSEEEGSHSKRSRKKSSKQHLDPEDALNKPADYEQGKEAEDGSDEPSALFSSAEYINSQKDYDSAMHIGPVHKDPDYDPPPGAEDDDDSADENEPHGAAQKQSVRSRPELAIQ